MTLSSHIEDEETKNIPNENHRYVSQDMTKTTRAFSLMEERTQSSSSTNNGRLKHLYTRFKRRFTITRDYRRRSEDLNKGISSRFCNYKSFSTSIEDSCDQFQWPDFEKIYDTIPSCLVKALPGLDDISLDEKDEDDKIDVTNIETDEIDDDMELFKHCLRGKSYRRNAVCHKLDKIQYNGQLDTFIQQLMIEKLMRTWT